MILNLFGPSPLEGSAVTVATPPSPAPAAGPQKAHGHTRIKAQMLLEPKNVANNSLEPENDPRSHSLPLGPQWSPFKHFFPRFRARFAASRERSPPCLPPTQHITRGQVRGRGRGRGFRCHTRNDCRRTGLPLVRHFRQGTYNTWLAPNRESRTQKDGGPGPAVTQEVGRAGPRPT